MHSFDTSHKPPIATLDVTDESRSATAELLPRRPGRPLEVTREQVIDRIRELSTASDGLFRVHLSAPGLYARARRLFGAWSAAVRLAGVDYEILQGVARARSLQTRRRDRRRPRQGGARQSNGETI